MGEGYCRYRIRNKKSGELLKWQGGNERMFKLLGDALVNFRDNNLSDHEYEIIEVNNENKKGGRKKTK